MLQGIRQINPVLRAIAVIGVVAALVTSITLALSSSATLTNNTISSASVNLLVNNQEDATDDFVESEAGFAFDNLVPGTPSEAMNFQLRNSGELPLDVYVQITGESALPVGVDGSDITFTFTSLTGDPTVTKTWAELIAAPGALLVNNMAANPSASEDIEVTVTLDESISAESVDITAFNFTFTGNTEEL